jgi:hypothetical protein
MLTLFVGLLIGGALGQLLGLFFPADHIRGKSAGISSSCL